jgi:hypothetical protein
VKSCLINHKRSPTFGYQLKKYQKLFPHIEEDLAATLSDVRLDYRTARHGKAMLHFNGTVFKYRMPCTDQGRGTRGGFRIIAYYDQKTNTLYPISMYPKSEQENIEDDEVERCVRELLEALNNSK